MWTTTERDGFMRRLAAVAEVFGEPMSPGRIAGYVALMDDLDHGDVCYGLQAAAKEEPYFPKPSQIRDRAHASAYRRQRVIGDTQRAATRPVLPLARPAPSSPEALTAASHTRTTLVSWIATMRERFGIR